jgi:hypothetical protein
MGCYQFYNLKNPMEDKIQRLVNAANSTNAKAKEIGEMQLRELGLDNNGNPLKSASTKESKPKAERKKREPKAKGEPKPKYKVGDVLNHKDSGETYKVKILAVTGWTGDGHRYDIEFLDENLKPMNKFAKSYDDKLSRTPKSKADQPYNCDDLIEQAEQRKAKAKANAIKRANEPKKTQATKNVEAVDRTAERVEKNVEKRVGKGDVSVAEIDKIIAEYETALKKLRALREKATSKMAKGGGVDAEEVEHILMKAQGVKEHHCGCGGSKMATGGSVKQDYFIYGSDDKKKTENYLKTKKYREQYRNDFDDVFDLKIIEVPYDDFTDYRVMATKKMATGGNVSSEIAKIKSSLISRAKSKGISESFGQNEVRKLEDKYGYTKEVQAFDDWAMNYDGGSMAKGGTIKVGDRVKSTMYKGYSGTIVGKSSNKDYWFVVLDEKLPNGDIQHDVFRKDEVEKIGKGDSMAKGGGVGEKISEAEAKNKLMSLKEKGEIILRTGNHGQIFMSLKGGQLKSYDDYTEAFHNWVVAKNRNSQ